MKNKFYIIAINAHCLLVRCHTCDHEIGFTAVDTFATMTEELAEHVCEPAPVFDLYGEYLANADLRN